jgi:hypothetical protein
MSSILEQIEAMNIELQNLKQQIGPAPVIPPKPIPFARSTTIEYTIARLINGKVGPVRRDGYTKIEVMIEAKDISSKSGLPIRFINWETNPASLSGDDSVLVVEQVYVKTNEGGGQLPIHSWIFSNTPPKWLNTEIMI